MSVIYIDSYRFGVGGVNWDPSLISTALWLDAADASTITESGGAVSQWNDKSGNGRHFDQSITAYQPSVSSAVLNGLDGIAFNLDFLDSVAASSTWTFLHNGTKWRMFSVVRFGNTANPNDVYVFFGTNGATTANVGASIWYDDRGSSSRNNQAAAIISQGTLNNAVVSHVAQDNFITANTFTLYDYFADPSNATAANRSQHFNAAVGSTTTNSSLNSPSTSPPTYNLQIGAVGTGASISPALMTLCEFVICSGDILSTDVAKTQGYLAHKWGLTANLPAAHPYKSAAPTV